jgi:hypothetical protein
MADSSSTTVDGKLVFTVASKDPVNLRLLAAADPSWKWSSSSSSAAAGLSAATLPALEGVGDVDIWLAAGKSIIIQIKPAG